MTAYLVIGLDDGDDVHFLHAHLPHAQRCAVAANIRSARFTWPEMKRQGVESSQAPATPVMALVPPGPVVTSATPRWLVALE